MTITGGTITGSVVASTQTLSAWPGVVAMSSKHLQYALRHAEKGLRVFPVARGGKEPCHDEIDSWKEEATTDEKQIRGWFDQPDPPNVGIATGEWERRGGVFVVDIDVGETDGHQTWKDRQAAEEEPVPETFTVDTPSGGTHHYFQAPPGVQIKSVTKAFGNSIDVKGHGGYVVTASSTTDEGAYVVQGDAPGEIARAPFWLVSSVRKEKENRDNREAESSAPTTSSPDNPDINVVEEALQAISPQPDYDKWIRVIAAVKDAVDSDRQAARLLEQWSPENRHGDYTYEERLRNAPDEQITAGTLFYFAEQEGWTPPWDHTGSPRGDGQVGNPPHPADPSWRVNSHPDDGDAEASLDDLDLQTAPEILAEDFEPLRPLVTYEERTVLPEGTSIIGAKPKMGKTFLSMNVSLGIASGGKALGRGSVRQGRVLYLNLDGSKRGMQERLDSMYQQEPTGPPEKLHMVHGEYPTVDEGGLDLLDQWCEQYPDTELIVIDTLQHLRPSSGGESNLYERDYGFASPIAKLGRRHKTSILLVHHLNKRGGGDDLDRITSSLGLSGAVENALILDRERESSEATLSVHPREGPDEQFHLEFDETLLTWTLGGIPTPGTPARKEVWEVVRAADGAIQLNEIAERVGSSTSTVTEHLNNLKTEDNVPVERPRQGHYRAA